MHVLVTGGAGFIGSNLVHALVQKGWIVDVIDDLSSGNLDNLAGLETRFLTSNILKFYEESVEPGDHKRVRFITGDFADNCVLRRIADGKYRYVFHLAAVPRVGYSVQFPAETAEVNLLRTIRLFEAASKSGSCRVIFSSSSSVYGNASVRPTPESITKRPRSPYALQKLHCEDYARLFRELHGLDFVALRYFNVYGPRQFGNSPYATAISAWCTAVHTGKPLRSDGDGTQSRDLTYVDDVVEANIKAALAGASCSGESYNIAAGKPVSNLKILEAFRDRYGDKVTITNAPWRAGDVMHTEADPIKARLQLGFACSVDFESGLRKTFEWWDNIVRLEEENHA